MPPSGRRAELLCVAPDLLDQFWPHVAPLLDEGCAAGNERLDDIATGLYRRESLLWIVWGDEQKILAAMVTRLIKDRNGVACQMGPVGGDMLWRWSEFHKQIEDYARREGCWAVRVLGRPGWERRLEGYRRVAVLIEKRL